MNLTLTFEHILDEFFRESTSTNIRLFFDELFDCYVKLMSNNAKKTINDKEMFNEIHQRQTTFLQLIRFIIPYDKKSILIKHFPLIIDNLSRRIDQANLEYLSYQLEILIQLITMKTSLDIHHDFFEFISKKLLQSSIDVNQTAWINLMKSFFQLIYLKQVDSNFVSEFLQTLAKQIQWSVESIRDYQTKYQDAFWRKIFIRLLASVNTCLTQRMKKTECLSLSSIKKFQKERAQLEHVDEESVARRLFEDEENIQHHEDMQQDLNQIQQQQIDLSILEKELTSNNSIFYSIEQFFELVKTKIDRKICF